MVDTYIINKLNHMIENFIEFLFNLAPGFWIFMAVCFVCGIIFVLFKNFKNFLVKPEW